jgi:transposase-like zinc ribbon protein
MSTDLPFPKSLPDFQRLFPDDAACAKYLEAIRFRDGFTCQHCNATGEPGRLSTRPHGLRCRSCRKETRLMAGTTMQDSHTPENTATVRQPDKHGICVHRHPLALGAHGAILTHANIARAHT